MKRLFFTLTLAIGLLTGCGQPNNATDVVGNYHGMLPCGSCEGVEVSLTLDKEGNFTLEEVYLDEEKEILNYEGQYQLKEDVVTLQFSEEELTPLQLKISGKKLNYLNDNSEVLPEYLLEKQ